MNHEFVNLFQTPHRRDENFKKSVRTLSARAYRRREREDRVQRHAQARLTPETSAGWQPSSLSQYGCLIEPVDQAVNPDSKSDTFEVDFNETENTRHLVPRSIGQSINSRFVDPFMTMSVPVPKENKVLLDHFDEIIGPTLMPLVGPHDTGTWSRIWLRHAVASPLLLLATCAHASLHIDFISSKHESLQSIRLKALTLRGLKDSIECHSDRNSDDMIGAIVMLAANTMIKGDASELNMHLSALKRLVSLRGGREFLGLDGLLEFALSWHHATYSILAPSLSPSDPVSDALSVPLAQPCQELGQLMQRSRVLSRMLERSISGEILSKSEIDSFVRLRSELESELVSGIFSASNRSANIVLDKCTYIALLMYSHSKFRKFRPFCAIITALSKELFSILSARGRMVELTLGPDQEECLFWVLSIATLLDTRNAEHRWLKQQYFAVRDRMKVQNEKQMSDILKKFVWTDVVWFL